MANKKRNNLGRKKGNYSYRITWGTGKNHQEISITLKTKNITEAEKHAKVVEVYVDRIKSGEIKREQFKTLFPWMNPERTSELRETTLEIIIPEYLAYKESKLRAQSVRRDKVSLNQFCDFVGYTKPIAELNYLDIEGQNGLINYLQNRGYENNGINITLRHLRTFFNWLHKKAKLIDDPIHFDMLPKGNQEYFIDEHQIQAIYNYIDDEKNGIDSFFKRCYIFYEFTGCRAAEPLLGELYGDWLYVDASKSKGKNLRKIQLSEELKEILTEIQAFRDGYAARKSPNPNEQAYRMISKTLLKITRALKFETNRKITIKSFRHSYGIRRVYLCGNIFQVAMEMGHKNVTTTQHYLRFQPDELKQYFPSLIPIIDNITNVQDGNKKMGTQYLNVFKLHG